MRPLTPRFVVLMVTTACAGLGQVAWGQDAEADQAQALLKKGMEEFKALNFVQAKATLLKADREKLSEADRKKLDDYLGRIDEAIKQQAEAREAYDNGIRALQANELEKAASLFEKAAASRFLPDPVRKNARAQQALVVRKIEAAKVAEAVARPKEPTTRPDVDEPKVQPPEPAAERPLPVSEDQKLRKLQAQIDQAKAETAEGEAAMTQGDLATAIKHFENALSALPEYEPARRLYAQAQGLLGRGAGEGVTAITRLEKQRELRRQQTRVLFDQAVKRAREALHLPQAPQDFARAGEEINYAQTLLAINRSLFGDAEYRARKTEVDKLLQYMEQQKQDWDKKRIKDQEAEVQRRIIERDLEVRRRRDEKVNMLKGEAKALRDQQKYAEAVQVLDRIRSLDPTDSWAVEWYHHLTRSALLQDQREAHRTYLQEEAKSLVDIQWTGVPWYEELRYPRDWPDITRRRMPYGAAEMAESEANRAVRRALGQVLPKLEFSGIPFGDVIQFVRDVSTANIHVKWEALRTANVDKNTAVNVKLAQVSVEKALKTILEDVGGQAGQLAFVVDEGVITISTQDDLSRKTVTRVYDIQDLIVRVPDFSAPRINLSSQGNNTGSNNTSGGLFGGNTNDDDDDDTGDDDEDTISRQELVDSILDLIRSTIAPDTWRGGQAAGTIGSIRELNGQIIVTQTAENHRSLLDLLSQLREARALQINVEARFITVNSGFLNRIGIDLDFYFNLGSRLFLDRVSTPSTSAIDLVTGALVPSRQESTWTLEQGRRAAGWNYLTPIGVSQGSAGFAGGPMETSVPGSIGGVTATALSFGGTFLDDVQVDFLVSATQAHQSTRTLIAPRITIFNGQRAYVAVAEQQAYVAELEPVVGENVVAFRPIIGQVSTGTVLDVEGTVSADRRYVTLTLRPQLSTILGFTQYLQGIDPVTGEPTESTGIVQLPNVQMTEVNCTVTVPDGGTLLLGGQKWAGEREREMGVPMISKIPVLNRLFTNRASVRDEQTLLILVRPKIIIPREAEEAAFPPQ